jgi:hypothetical protein
LTPQILLITSRRRCVFFLVPSSRAASYIEHGPASKSSETRR